MIKKLGEIYKVTSGGTPSRDKSDYYENGTIPWVKTGDLKVKDLFNIGECITELGLQNSSAKIFPKDTVLIAMYGATIGACSILRVPACSNQACAAFLPNEKVIPEFLYFFLKSVQPLLISKGVGGGQPNISGTILKEIEIPVPDLIAQQKIAQILSEADKARQLRKQANALTDQFLQSTFLNMFGDPVSNPKGWKTGKLCDFGDWKSGGTPSRQKDEYFHGHIPWYSSGELNQMYISGSKESITADALTESNAKLIPNGSLLLGMYDTAALKSSITTIPCACNQAIAYAELKTINNLYAYFAIQLGKEHFKSTQRGVRQKNLNLTMIKDIKLPVPSPKLQQQFADIVTETEQLRHRQRAHEQELDQLFKGLLHKYFG